MAHMNKEKKAVIVAAVKPILKKYGLKASFSVDNYSTINLNIKSGPIDFGGDNLSLGEYSLSHNHNFNENAVAFLEEVIPAMKSAGWFDKSDAMTDYFHIAYFININVGRWNKPYILEA